MNKLIRPFHRLRTNVKIKADVELGPLTLVVGEAESGKSALGHDSVRLALSGKHKIGHNPSDLIQLAASPREGIEVLLDGPDGSASWRLRVDSEGKPKKPEAPDLTGALSHLTDDERSRILPTYSLNDFMQARGQKKIREALLRRWGGGLDALQAPMGLLPVEKLAWDAARKSVESKMEEQTSASVLAGLSEVFRRASMERSRVIRPLMADIERRKQEVRDSTRPPDMLPIFEQQLVALGLKGKLEKEQQEIDRCRNALTAAEARIFERRNEVAGYAATLKKAEEAQSALEAEEDALKLEDLSFTEKVAAQRYLKGRYEASQHAGHSKCPLCPNTSVDVAQMIGIFNDAIERTEKNREGILAKKSQLQLKLNAARKETQDARLKCSIGQNQLSTAEASHAEFLAAMEDRIREGEETIRIFQKELSRAPSVYPGSTEESLKADIEAIKLSGQKRSELEAEVVRLRGIEEEAKMFALLERQAIQMQKDVLADIAKRASEEVSKRMLNGQKVEFDPITCEWYIITDRGGRHPYGAFCGTQETSFKLAFARAWTADAPLRVAVFDDYDLVGLSRKGMKEFFAMCEEAVTSGDLTQVIVVWNRPDEAPDAGSWKVIELKT